MFAKQTAWSASLGLAIGIVPMIARADPPAPAASPDGATGSFSVGGGYATDAHLFLTANIAQSDLFGTGDALSLFAGYSALHELFAMRLVQPHVLDSDYTLDTQLYNDMRALPGFTRLAVGGTSTLGTQLTDHVRAFVGWRLEQVTGEPSDALYTVARGVPGAPPLGDDLISAARAGVEYDTRNSRIMPTAGTDAGVAVEYASPLLGSDLELGTVTAWAGTHQPIGPAILHLEGTFTALASPGVIPLADRLFMMGSMDVRGYLPGAFGPTDADGDPIGGNLKLTGRGSVEVPLGAEGLSLEGFFDYARISDTSMSNLYGFARGYGMSVGFGVIWRSPLGPLRLDFAIPLVHGGTPGLVFGLGQMF
ncbi:MAG TPA: BamA/TamA family outer membrane protein [Kofleriaceae bacterium]|nr:BamA/TamA family outer membrane protein [Kofleriaceae bacterium]